MVLLAGCNGGGGGDDDDGSPTPDAQIVIEPVITISGTTTIEQGECVGFRIQTENFDVASPRVLFGPYELATSFYYVLDADTVQVGFPCFYTGLNLPLGALAVSLLEDEREAVNDAAFDVVETTRLDLGEAPADSAGLAGADANALDADYDFDVYDWSAPADGLYLAEVVLGTGADPGFLPYTYVARASLNPWWNGHELVLANTLAGDHLAEIADDRIQGGAGYEYTLRVTPLPAAVALAADDTCSGAALFTSAGLFTVDLTAAVDDVDPAGVQTCADRHVPDPPFPGEGVDAPGPDRMLRLVVGSGQTLSVAARGAVTDAVLYLLPDDGLGCDPAPDPCLAAADTFGISDSETLLWTNAGPDRNVWLVVDEFGGDDSDPGAVTLFLRID